MRRDAGVHVVCAAVTQTFLDFSRGRGNDLITPHAASGSPRRATKSGLLARLAAYGLTVTLTAGAQVLCSSV